MKIRVLQFLTLFIAMIVAAQAQRPPDYDRVVVQQNRIDCRDLGYPPVDVIPNGESSVTSLTIAPNGNLYGATSGAHSHLFVLNPRHGYVQPLGFLPETTAVRQALAVSRGGELFVGTSPTGRILKYVPKNEDLQPIRIKEPCAVEDMGEAVKGESIHALTIDRDADAIYGLTSPKAVLFRYSIAERRFVELGVVARRPPAGEKFETEKTMSRMLLVDVRGNVYCSGEDGHLFKFDKETQRLEKLDAQLPAVPGREPWTRADAFLVGADKTIYGGTSDGYMFRFDPENSTIRNLGKPLLQYRIAGLAAATNGKIYGVGGDEDEMARLFSYDPVTAAFEILGFVDVNRRPYYTWQAHVIQALVAGLDGTIYIGEAERISRLYLFYPW